MTKRMKDVGWLLVLALGSACSGGDDSDTASQTGKVAEAEAREPTEPSADATKPAGDGASAEEDPGEPEETSADPDISEPEAMTASTGETIEEPMSPEPATGGTDTVLDCAAPNVECPPPPIGWCGSDHDIPIEDWLAEYWDSFCDDAAAPDAGAGDDDPAPTGSAPPDADAIACGIAIGGPGASPCPPPPLDWCASDRDDAPVPSALAVYWNSTCGDAESGL